MNFSNKLTGEIDLFGFNLAPIMPTGTGRIVSAIWSITVLSGTDPAPEGMLRGAPFIDGKIVRHKLGGGVSGTHYRVSVTVTTTTGLVLIERATLSIS